VTSEGPLEFLFTGPQGQEVAEAQPAAEVPLPLVIINAKVRGCIDLKDMGNLAGPENSPGKNQVCDVVYQNWGHSGICYC